MADEPVTVKLISTENEGASVKFSLTRKKNEDYLSPIFDIYDIAKIQIGLSTNYGYWYHIIKVRKCELAKKLEVKLHVLCKKLMCDVNILCTENWTDHNMGKSDDECINIQIDVVTNQPDLMALKLYKDEEFTDFQLGTAEGSAGVAVHKAQLAASSEVFKKMLTREWKETTEGHINMEGVTLQTLQYLKDYMYMGDLPEGEENLHPLLLIARCYLMYNLRADCLEKLTETVTSETLYHNLEFSFFNQLPELTIALIGATSKNMADDALEIMIKNKKKQTEQKQSDEGTNK